MIKHINITSLILLTLTLVGCASPPRIVNAKIPLVEPSSYVSNEIIPSRFWAILDNPDNKHLDYLDYTVTIGTPYDSALGARCRLLAFSQNNNIVGQRTACAKKNMQSNENLWFLTKDILDEQTVVSLK